MPDFSSTQKISLTKDEIKYVKNFIDKINKVSKTKFEVGYHRFHWWEVNHGPVEDNKLKLVNNLLVKLNIVLKEKYNKNIYFFNDLFEKGFIQKQIKLHRKLAHKFTIKIK